MQLEVRILNFKEASNWDFNGMLPPFASDATPLMYVATLSQPELDKMKRETLSQPGADQTSYPKMTIEEGKPATTRSVVNHPVLADSSQDGNTARSTIEYLPIGFIGNFTVKRIPEGKFLLNIDIKHSQIIGETQVAGNPYPIVRSAVYQAPVELSAGMSTVVYGWELHHQNRKPRPVLYVLTPGVVAAEPTEPEKKPLPATITADQTTFDEKTGIGRYTGHAKLEPINVNGKDDRSPRGFIEWADGAQNHPRQSSLNR